MTHPKEDGFSITHREGGQPVSNPYKFDDEIAWLQEASRYFSKRPTGGEDAAHWSNVYNAENANKIASHLDVLSSRPAPMEGQWSHGSEKPGKFRFGDPEEVQALAVIPTEGGEGRE